MTSSEPMRPFELETVLFEPDQQRTLAVLPGLLWLAPGDVVELEGPPRDARVLSTRLQLREGMARVLVVLDVPDDGVDALRGEEPTESILGAELDVPDPAVTGSLEAELASLESDLDAAPEEGERQP